jgi:hypothetical protein
MGRPRETGLKFYAVTCHRTPQEELLIEETGWEGWGILQGIYSQIFRAGYFIEYDEILLRSLRKEGVGSSSLEKIEQVISVALKWGIFNQNLFKNYKVLTSKDIQEQFEYGTKKRVKIIHKRQELLLISFSAPETPVIVPESTHTTLTHTLTPKNSYSPREVGYWMAYAIEQGFTEERGREFFEWNEERNWTDKAGKTVCNRKSAARGFFRKKRPDAEPIPSRTQQLPTIKTERKGIESPAIVEFFFNNGKNGQEGFQFYAECLAREDITLDNWQAKALKRINGVAA